MVVSSDNGLAGVNLMSFTQTTLKNWKADLCGNDEECEQKLRNLLSQDREVLNTILLQQASFAIAQCNNMYFVQKYGVCLLICYRRFILPIINSERRFNLNKG
jgi:hypothetical protein